ncbi:hypothetical protein Phi13:1_gp104 [Cellulophaga phage phi13:1]|uniref:Uncharacterized protein n=1 Tax=Cellulophaga phage phi13:1 TaxID=1327992 RepID=S0A2T7_9CAUD|nr:hypothetical protein Phi13:1_gp104 [Cellulophaga phage phi13:1]
MNNMTIDFKIDIQDLQALFIATRDGYKRGVTFHNWTQNCEADYEQYFKRQVQLNEKPKTFSQWVNGQTIALT